MEDNDDDPISNNNNYNNNNNNNYYYYYYYYYYYLILNVLSVLLPNGHKGSLFSEDNGDRRLVLSPLNSI